MNNGYIKLFRKIKEWKWYKNVKTFKAFIHCLLEANYTDKKYENQIIPRGSFLTGRKKFADECGLSEQETRSAWTNLKSTNEITINSTSKGTVITVVNYEDYQPLVEMLTNESTNTLTNNQPTINQQITTTKNNKNINNIISSSYIEEIRTHVYQFYETNFAKLLSPIEKEELDDWIDYFQNEEVLKYGIRIAVLNRVATMNYLNGIYQNWKDNGYKTLEDCKPKEKEEKEKLELFEYDWFEDEEPH